MKKYISMIICTVILITLLTACIGNDHKYGLEEPVNENSLTLMQQTENSEPETSLIDTFSFALEWNVNGDSTYDSKTGVLVKQKIATDPDEFTTTLKLSDEQLAEAYGILSKLDYSDYPDEGNYNPSDMFSIPSDTLILTVRIGDVTEKIIAKNIAINAVGKDKAGERFIDACNSLKSMIYATSEWQSLPDYEFLYD